MNSLRSPSDQFGDGTVLFQLPLLFAEGRPRDLHKMTLNQLEKFVNFMIQCLYNDASSVEKTPSWWPKNVVFSVPLVKPPFLDDPKWLATLKSVVVRCYSHLNCEFLLKFSAILADFGQSQIAGTMGKDGCISLYHKGKKKLLVTVRKENILYDKIQRCGITLKKYRAGADEDEYSSVSSHNSGSVSDKYPALAQDTDLHYKLSTSEYQSNPKSLQKEQYLGYFNLQSATKICKSKSEKSARKVVLVTSNKYKYRNIPISSELGELIFSRVACEYIQERIDRLERYSSARPGDKGIMDYREPDIAWLITWRPNQKNECWVSQKITKYDTRKWRGKVPSDWPQAFVRLKRLTQREIDKYTSGAAKAHFLSAHTSRIRTSKKINASSLSCRATHKDHSLKGQMCRTTLANEEHQKNANGGEESRQWQHVRVLLRKLSLDETQKYASLRPATAGEGAVHQLWLVMEPSAGVANSNFEESSDVASRCSSSIGSSSLLQRLLTKAPYRPLAPQQPRMEMHNNGAVARDELLLEKNSEIDDNLQEKTAASPSAEAISFRCKRWSLRNGLADFNSGQQSPALLNRMRLAPSLPVKRLPLQPVAEQCGTKSVTTSRQQSSNSSMSHFKQQESMSAFEKPEDALFIQQESEKSFRNVPNEDESLNERYGAETLDNMSLSRRLQSAENDKMQQSRNKSFNKSVVKVANNISLSDCYQNVKTKRQLLVKELQTARKKCDRLLEIISADHSIQNSDSSDSDQGNPLMETKSIWTVVSKHEESTSKRSKNIVHLFKRANTSLESQREMSSTGTENQDTPLKKQDFKLPSRNISLEASLNWNEECEQSVEQRSSKRRKSVVRLCNHVKSLQEMCNGSASQEGAWRKQDCVSQSENCTSLDTSLNRDKECLKPPTAPKGQRQLVPKISFRLLKQKAMAMLPETGSRGGRVVNLLKRSGSSWTSESKAPPLALPTNSGRLRPGANETSCNGHSGSEKTHEFQKPILPTPLALSSHHGSSCSSQMQKKTQHPSAKVPQGAPQLQKQGARYKRKSNGSSTRHITSSFPVSPLGQSSASLTSHHKAADVSDNVLAVACRRSKASCDVGQVAVGQSTPNTPNLRKRHHDSESDDASSGFFAPPIRKILVRRRPLHGDASVIHCSDKNHTLLSSNSD